ncbi:MAG: hypothetical protein NTY25_04220 [Planctomycetia bacterium]|nr:hypothetical protein [Planctomycetia bacterium]
MAGNAFRLGYRLVKRWGGVEPPVGRHMAGQFATGGVALEDLEQAEFWMSFEDPFPALAMCRYPGFRRRRRGDGISRQTTRPQPTDDPYHSTFCSEPGKIP